MITSTKWRLKGSCLMIFSMVAILSLVLVDDRGFIELFVPIIFTICILLVGLFLIIASYDQPAKLALNQNIIEAKVFNPHYGLDIPIFNGNSSTIDSQILFLRQGKLKLDPYRNFTMDLKHPIWQQKDSEWSYFEFSLHTLRFLVPMLYLGKHGEQEFFGHCKSLITQWAEHHRLEDSPRFHECFRQTSAMFKKRSNMSCYAWADEHSVAWRSITLSHVFLVWQKQFPKDINFLNFLNSLAEQHGAYLCRQSNYRYEHNHGLNNALALVALASAFSKLSDARYWLGLGIHRAEQQMRDNVSIDGIHLEQSGFYHFYTLRSFVEILKAVQMQGLDLSAAYKAKLSLMLTAAAAMLESDLTVKTLPYSDPVLNMKDFINRDVLATCSFGNFSSGFEFFVCVLDKLPCEVNKSLIVFDQGGYSFFQARFPDELRVTFHTRILVAGHAQEDAMGISVCYQGKPLIIFPSTLRLPIDSTWQEYFHSAIAHNTIQIQGQRPKPRPEPRQSGWLSALFNSYKINTLIWKTDTMDIWIALKRILGADLITLVQRASSVNGTVLSHGCSEEIAFVRARNWLYDKVSHTRTVIRIGQGYLIVWDEMKADIPYQYTQTFHFADDLEFRLSDMEGEIRRNGVIVARFLQLNYLTKVSLISGRTQPQKRGWYADGSELPRPIPTLQYTIDADAKNFIWLFQVGHKILSGKMQGKYESFSIQIDNDTGYTFWSNGIKFNYNKICK